ncbi:MAG: hypothetical protein ALAOOOJD_01004 [bacterium]|nr:hypothetical protein [bacterium]
MLDSLSPQYPSRLTVIIIIFFLAAPLYGLAGFLGNFSASKWPVLIGEVLLPVPVYLYLRSYRYNLRKIFRLHMISRPLMLLSAGLAVAIYLLVQEIHLLLNAMWAWLWRFLPPEFELFSPQRLQLQLEQLLTAQNGYDWILLILATVIIAGFCEEIVFRGFVQIVFEQHHRILTAILLTAAIFTLIHGVPWWFLQIFLLGLCLSWMAWRSDSIIPGAIVHGLNNLLAVCLINFKSNLAWLFWPGSEEGHVHPLVLLVAGGASYWGYKLFNRFCEEETEIPTFLNTSL